MSHALPAPQFDLDAKRILATAATIAIHVLALMLLLAPMEAPPAPIETTGTVVPVWTPPKPPPVMPPPPPRQVVRPREMPHATPTRTTIAEDPPVVSDTPDPMATAYVPVDPRPIETIDPPPSGPVALAVLEGPAPTYPASAIRMNITGRVLLRIEVDASGHPVSGVIEQSSGSSLLDNAALKVVLKKWRFVPAQHAGQPIAATALVPIVFSLD
jgi:protein TonB